MTGCLVALLWAAASVSAGVVFGRGIRLADQRRPR